jgi:tetratricopeptide (TPR) repeat protein
MAALSLCAEDAGCRAGLDQYSKGDYAAAQRLLSECVESHRGNGNHSLYLALTYRSLKNYDAGLRRTEAALARSPDDVDLLYLAAWLRYRRNETKDSMLLLSKAHRLAPKDWRLHQLFALNYISFDMLDTARLSLLQAIALNPRNAELYYQLGRLDYTQNHFEDSLGAMKSALSLVPDYPEAYDSLGLIYEALREDKRAAECYAKAIELGRSRGIRDEWPYIDFGAFLIERESPRESLPLLSQALKFNPASTKANYQMGRALRALGRQQEAAKYFEKAIELDPSFPSAYYHLATLMRDRGDQERFRVLISRFRALTRESERLKTGTTTRTSTSETSR